MKQETNTLRWTTGALKCQLNKELETNMKEKRKKNFKKHSD